MNFIFNEYSTEQVPAPVFSNENGTIGGIIIVPGSAAQEFIAKDIPLVWDSYLSRYTYSANTETSSGHSYVVQFWVKHEVDAVETYTEFFDCGESNLTSLAFMFEKFGVENVIDWAKFGAETDVQAYQRISACLNYADTYVETYIDQPNSSWDSIPEILREIATLNAGIRLYEARGTDNEDGISDRPGHRYSTEATEARRTLHRIKVGRLNIGQANRTRIPVSD